MRDNVPDYKVFNEKAKETFSDILVQNGYTLVQEISKINYVKLVYKNKNFWKKRLITIENQTFPVDYGFSFVVSNIRKKQNYMFYVVPWEKQDKECVFLNRVSQFILSHHDIVDVISGKIWNLKRLVSFSE